MLKENFKMYIEHHIVIYKWPQEINASISCEVKNTQFRAGIQPESIEIREVKKLMLKSEEIVFFKRERESMNKDIENI